MKHLLKKNNWEAVKNPDGLDGYWITGADIGERMGYANPRKAIVKIFKRNKDFFIYGVDYADPILGSPSGAQKTIVFSERGAIKLTRYSRKPLADEVMQSIIDFYIEKRKQQHLDIAKLRKHAENPIIKLVIEQEEIREEQDRQLQMIIDAHRKIDVIEATVADNEEYFKARAYCRKVGLKLTDSQLKKFGKQAVMLSAHMGYSVEKQDCSNWGTVNKYHVEVLRELERQWFCNE